MTVVDIILKTNLPMPTIHQCYKGKRYRGRLTGRQSKKSSVVFISPESGAECMAFHNEFRIVREVKDGSSKKNQAIKHKNYTGT